MGVKIEILVTDIYAEALKIVICGHKTFNQALLEIKYNNKLLQGLHSHRFSLHDKLSSPQLFSKKSCIQQYMLKP